MIEDKEILQLIQNFDRKVDGLTINFEAVKKGQTALEYEFRDGVGKLNGEIRILKKTIEYVTFVNGDGLEHRVTRKAFEQTLYERPTLAYCKKQYDNLKTVITTTVNEAPSKRLTKASMIAKNWYQILMFIAVLILIITSIFGG